MTKPQSNFAQLRDFLSYLATVKGDLSNITAPPFVLSPRSVTEIPAAWAEHQPLFLAPATEPDPARRALLVLENFLCSLKGQVYTASASADSGAGAGSDGGVKKPLNAFLGELFLGAFMDGDDDENSTTTQLISEQVSHHPPVTACCLYNKAHGISSSGYVAQQTTFSVSRGVVVRQVGHAIIRDEGHGESHLMTLPTMAVKNLMLGCPYPELTGTCYLVSSSGYLSTVVFEGRRTSLYGMGKSNGTRNSVRATLVSLREGNKPLFEVAGQWNGVLQVKDLRQEGSSPVVIDEFHVDNVARSKLQTKPLSEQSPWESRRAWAGVHAGIRAGDLQKVSAAKTDIEEGQRAIRRAEREAGGGLEWPRLFFTRAEGDQEFAVLARAIPDPEARGLQLERTGGGVEVCGGARGGAVVVGGAGWGWGVS
ncbi:KES1 [Apiospora aurea]|uniref:KES1 n=1 Tax=Apiospora aurea TaxID=335848 RepID=A0ABR1QSI1_9PEZI